MVSFKVSRGALVAMALVSIGLSQGIAAQALVVADTGFNPSSDGGGAYTQGVFIDNNVLGGSYRNGGALDTRGNSRHITWDLSRMNGFSHPGGLLAALARSNDSSHDARISMLPYQPGAWNDGRLESTETIPLRALAIGETREFYLNFEVQDNVSGAFEFSGATHNGFSGFSAQVTRLSKSSWTFEGSGDVRIQLSAEFTIESATLPISFNMTFSR